MFNINLRNIRLNLGYSQKYVADYLNVSSQSVSKWEKGDALPSILYLPQLAECLSCNINDFFVISDENVYDFEMLDQFFGFMKEYIINRTMKPEEFIPFLNQYPDCLAVLRQLSDDFKQYQTVKNKTIQRILNCSEEETIKFINYFIEQEWIEKLEHDDSYFVNKSNIDGLKIVLITLIEVIDLKSKLN